MPDDLKREFEKARECLSRSPAMAGEAVAIPAGYALVPVKITDAMIESAMEHHYGKRRVRQHGGAAGIAMTVNEHDWSGVDAMRRLWKGALAATPQPAQADARVGLTDALRRAREELSIVEWENDAPNRVVKLFDEIDALLAAHAGQPEPRVAGAIPRVHGVSRFADNPCTVLVMLMAEATDDALRAIHDRLTCQPEPRAEVTECCNHTWESCHKGDGCEFRIWLAARTGASS